MNINATETVEKSSDASSGDGIHIAEVVIISVGVCIFCVISISCVYALNCDKDSSSTRTRLKIVV